MTGHRLRMSEADFQASVVRMARDWGWLVHHTRTVQERSGRWATPIQGDRGFPDLVLAHPRSGVIFAELKSEAGRMAPDQLVWADALNLGLMHRDAETVLWRPSDTPAIINRLIRDGRP